MIELIATLLFLQVNLYRLDNGVPYVEMNQDTCQMAEKRVEMIKTKWSHEGGSTVKPHIEDTTYEDLGEGYTQNPLLNSQIVLKLWKESPTHNEILLKEMESMCVRTDGRYFVLTGINYGNN
jgi:hypothetical protein